MTTQGSVLFLKLAELIERLPGESRQGWSLALDRPNLQWSRLINDFQELQLRDEMAPLKGEHL